MFAQFLGSGGAGELLTRGSKKVGSFPAFTFLAAEQLTLVYPLYLKCSAFLNTAFNLVNSFMVKET